MGEDATEFGFPGLGSAVGLFTGASGKFFGTAGDSGAVGFNIEDRDGLE